MGIADRNRAATFLRIQFLSIPSIWQFQHVSAETLIDASGPVLGGFLELVGRLDGHPGTRPGAWLPRWTLDELPRC